MSMIGFGQRLAVVVAALTLLSVLVAAPAIAKPPSWSHKDTHVCLQERAGHAGCTSVARAFYVDGAEYHAKTKSDIAHAAAAAQSTYFHGPDIRTAYGITAQGDPSKVIAIVDAYDDPGAFANLTRFRTDQALPADPELHGRRPHVSDQRGDRPVLHRRRTRPADRLCRRPTRAGRMRSTLTSRLHRPSVRTCSILLLEGNTSSVLDLGTAVTTASNTAHVLAISNSYGVSGDYPASFAPAFDNAAKKGIAVLASAGDGGYGVLFPASATNVIGVGGTTLSVDATGVRSGETVWSGTGSGCSTYNSAPAWQKIPNSPCGTKKAISDLSADADPGSGLAIYTTYGGTTGYWVFGGTSLSSPLVAALYVMQGGYGPSTLAGQYAWASTTPYFDVTSGSNGTCSPSVKCTAGAGWDGPTGRGSISTAAPSPAVLTMVKVTPASASLPTGGTQQFSATGYDQYAAALSPRPTSLVVGRERWGRFHRCVVGSVFGRSGGRYRDRGRVQRRRLRHRERDGHDRGRRLLALRVAGLAVGEAWKERGVLGHHRAVKRLQRRCEPLPRGPAHGFDGHVHAQPRRDVGDAHHHDIFERDEEDLPLARSPA